MTGYGKGQTAHNGRQVTIEVKAVNHRFLDLNLKLPKGFLFLDDLIRKTLSKVISRGHLDVYVTYDNQSEDKGSYICNNQLGKDFYFLGELLSREIGIENDLTISSIMKAPDVLERVMPEENEEELKNLVVLSLASALTSLEEMRIAEGDEIKKDLALKLDILKKMRDEIESLSPKVTVDYKEKLTARISEYLAMPELDEQRIATEVALFADRSAIDEELTRLKSHFKQFDDLLVSEDPVGRKLDFLLQEINRETNTIGSKANFIEITNLVLKMKNEIEKIREQVQNIE
ncbi:yicC domain protein [Acidaminococcus sp. CAG:917]|nr:yicC domain protein [Acidaminococcus sp. CAG:917]